MTIKSTKKNNRSPSSVKTASGAVRIIGGRWRGRRLSVLNSPGLRPTTDRVRETLFNWLMPIIHQARCLDCFAGSGALGFEAVSRGAAYARLIECSFPVVQKLNENCQLLKTDQIKVQQVDTLHWLSQSPAYYNEQPFDVVFLDPPFRQGMLHDTINALEQQTWLADECWIYIELESEAELPVLPVYWHLHREKTAGQVAYRLYHREKQQTTMKELLQ